MSSKFIIFILLTLLPIAAVIAFRFGLFEPILPFAQPTGIFTNVPELSPTILPPSIGPPTRIGSASAKISIVAAPLQTSTNEKLAIQWFIDSDNIATISHTAVHYGKNSQPRALLPSDYPEKSTILKGTIPATFSATLSIAIPGLYYYRAHAWIDTINVWSDELQIQITDLASPSATPTP